MIKWLNWNIIDVDGLHVNKQTYKKNQCNNLSLVHKIMCPLKISNV